MKIILSFPRVNSPNPGMARLQQSKIYAEHEFALKSADTNVSVTAAREFIDFWHPAGCIVNNDRLPVELFRGIPTVYLHRSIQKLPPRAALVSYDENAIAKLAARELLSHGYASYVYIPHNMAAAWDNRRMKGFIRAMDINFSEVSVYPSPPMFTHTVRAQKKLASWLKMLPRPIGIFAACDRVAALVLDACIFAGLNVPGDAAIIGVDNDETICETTHPALTSVYFDHEADRRRTLDLLMDLIGNLPQRQTIIHYQPSGIIRRGSSMPLRHIDPAVVAARDLIRQRATQGLKARDVLATFDCGRRMAEIRFRAATGHSVLEEILAERRRQAEALMASRTLKTVGIAARCGYASWSSVHRLLHRSRGFST